jgi:hypothetical protein
MNILSELSLDDAMEGDFDAKYNNCVGCSSNMTRCFCPKQEDLLVSQMVFDHQVY